MSVVAAVDCGATSVRICRVDLAAAAPVPEVVHRSAHAPRPDGEGHLRWDWPHILASIIRGLERCLELGPLASIGVDTWAVDYGLLGENGALLSPPYSYRDRRTAGYLELVDAVGADELYRINGLQLQPFNTVFQLAYHDPDEKARATRLLWLPELIVHHLTGVAVTERTSAGSSGLLDVSSGDWSSQLLDLAGVDRAQVGVIEPAGRIVGHWRGVPVSLVGGHDTASAVAGMGPTAPGGSAFVASGTWMLAGVERAGPDTSDWAREHNFTNEAGVGGGTRFLRNVTGFWLLERCRPAWGDPDIASLVAAAGSAGAAVPLVDVDDERLRSPDDMLATYLDLAGLPDGTSPGIVARSIIESIAARTGEVIDQVTSVVDVDDVVLFGGAARMGLLVRRLGERTGLPVRVGTAEAAALGNALVQGVAIGRFASLDEARRSATTS